MCYKTYNDNIERIFNLKMQIKVFSIGRMAILGHLSKAKLDEFGYFHSSKTHGKMTAYRFWALAEQQIVRYAPIMAFQNYNQKWLEFR